jgi:hypothetical protein
MMMSPAAGVESGFDFAVLATVLPRCVKTPPREIIATAINRLINRYLFIGRVPLTIHSENQLMRAMRGKLVNL